MVSELISDLHASVEQDFRGNALRDIVLQLVPQENRRVLDLGCGAGTMSLALASRGHEVTAADIDPDLVDLVDAGAVERGIPVKPIVMGVTDILEFGESSFDAIVCLDVLEHLADDGRAVQLIAQVLRPGGVLVVSMPADPRLYGKRDKTIGHYRRYTKKQLRDLLVSGGFQVDFIRSFCMLGLPPYILFEKILRRPIYDGLRKRSSPVSAVVAKVLRLALRIEWKARVPFGLTLVGRAQNRR